MGIGTASSSSRGIGFANSSMSHYLIQVPLSGIRYHIITTDTRGNVENHFINDSSSTFVIQQPQELFPEEHYLVLTQYYRVTTINKQTRQATRIQSVILD
jgi:hypothetical protein